MRASSELTSCLRHIDEAAMLELAADLVKIRTVNDPGATSVEEPAARHVADVMRSFGWAVTVTEVVPGRPNVVAVLEGSAPGRTLMFEGHSDVVTEGDPADWGFDPFVGDIVDGRLRGRGSADMKAGVAAMIHATRAVELTGFVGRIVVGVLADEEGLMLGAKAFAASLRAGAEASTVPNNAPGLGSIDGVIVCEPEGGEVCPVSKGAIRLRIDVTGRMAHGAMPQMGRNPVPVIGRLLLALDEVGSQLSTRHPAHPDLGEVYVTPTVLAAGDPAQINVIPATASVSVDIRTIPGVDHAQLISLVQTISEMVAKEADTSAAVTVLDDRPPVELAADHPLVAALAAAHEEVTGVAAVLGGVPGTTDGTILTRDAGLATVVYGPGGKWIAHQVDEYVEVDDIITSARVYAAAAVRFLEGR